VAREQNIFAAATMSVEYTLSKREQAWKSRYYTTDENGSERTHYACESGSESWIADRWITVSKIDKLGDAEELARIQMRDREATFELRNVQDGKTLQSEEYFWEKETRGERAVWGKDRIFVAPDGREYRWVLENEGSMLFVHDDARPEVLVAQLHRARGVWHYKPPRLEIFEAGAQMVDFIMCLFPYFEKIRVEAASTPKSRYHCVT